MAWKATLAILIAGFVGLNVFALIEKGGSGLLSLLATGDPWLIALCVDLTLALGFLSLWHWRDARARGKSYLPYLIATAVLGSIPPMLYLLGRPKAPTADTSPQ